MNSPIRWLLGTCLIGLALWLTLVFIVQLPSVFLPSPEAVLRALIHLTREGVLWNATLTSIGRITLGFCLSTLFSLPLGCLIGRYLFAQHSFGFVFALLRYLPPSALIPLSILWLGLGESQKITFIVIGVVPYLTLLISDAILNVPTLLIDVARTLGAREKDVLLHILLPAALPAIWDALRLMIGVAWSLVVLAEVVGATSGLGYLVALSQRFVKTANAFAALFVIAMIGAVVDLALRYLRRRLFPWSEVSSYVFRTAVNKTL